MRCVNCGRMASADDTQCPYCGCPVLTAAETSRHKAGARVRRLWEESTLPENVVALPRRPRIRMTVSLVAGEALVWGSVWLIVAGLLGVLSVGWAWLVPLLLLAVNLVIYQTYNIEPWHQRLLAKWREEEQPPDDQDDTTGNHRVSGM